MHQKSELLKDLVVLEFASVLAGPAVGMFFAELGAKVIKVENPTTGGDVTRSWKHSSENKASKHSAYYHSVNYNKTIKFINIKDRAYRSELVELIRSSDIVLSNFRHSSALNLEMDYEALKAIKPTLIYGQISAYGEDDNRPGFDALIQAETGWMSMNGQADGPPTKMPVALIDILAAHQLKEGILVALLHRLRTGKGSKVSVSLYDTAIASLANQASNFLNLKVVPQRKGSQHPNIAPYGDIFLSKDNKHILLAIGSEKQFQLLAKALQLPELARDSRFSTNKARVENRSALNAELHGAMSNRDSEEIIELATTYELPIGRIRDLSEVFSDSHSQRLILDQQEQDGSTSKRVQTVTFQLKIND